MKWGTFAVLVLLIQVLWMSYLDTHVQLVVSVFKAHPTHLFVLQGPTDQLRGVKAFKIVRLVCQDITVLIQEVAQYQTCVQLDSIVESKQARLPHWMVLLAISVLQGIIVPQVHLVLFPVHLVLSQIFLVLLHAWNVLKVSTVRLPLPDQFFVHMVTTAKLAQ